MPRKKRFWQVDPAIFQRSGKNGIRERITSFLRSAGKFLAYLLILTYPLSLPLVGLLYGGLAFWGTFAGSAVVMMVVLSKLGYGRTFAARDFPFLKTLVALFGGFFFAMGLYLGLIFLRFWTLPIAFGLSVLGIAYFVIRRK